MTGFDPRCLSGKRCVSRTVDGPASTIKPDSLCPGCILDIQKCFNELPDYLLALRAFMGFKPGSVGQSKVSGGATEGSSPFNVTVADLRNEIAGVLAEVGEYSIRDYVTLDAYGPFAALRVRALHSQADGIVGFGRVWERRRVACPDCGLPTLGGWLGEGRIYCTNSECATTLSKAEYEEYCEAVSRGF